MLLRQCLDKISLAKACRGGITRLLCRYTSYILAYELERGDLHPHQLFREFREVLLDGI